MLRRHHQLQRLHHLLRKLLNRERGNTTALREKAASSSSSAGQHIRGTDPAIALLLDLLEQYMARAIQCTVGRAAKREGDVSSAGMDRSMRIA